MTSISPFFAFVIMLFSMTFSVSLFAANDGVHIAVLPFEGAESGGFSLAEAIEFEMEVLDNVVVESSRGPAKAWFKAQKKRGKKRLRNKDRRKILKKFKLDALLIGESGVDEDGDPALHVIGYGKNGKARFYEVFPLPEDIDQAASGIVRALSTLIKKWNQLPSIKVRIPKLMQENQSDPDGVLVDAEQPRRKNKNKNKTVEEPKDEFSELFVDDGLSKKNNKSRKHFSAHSSNYDRDVQAHATNRRSLSGRGKKRAIKRRKKPPSKGYFSLLNSKDDLLSFASASMGLQGATWRYFFDAINPEQSLLGDKHRTSFITPYPAGYAQAEIWPIEWVGLAVDGNVAYLPFKINDGTGRIANSEFSLLQFGAGALLRARYVHRLSLGKKIGKLGIGGGIRAGYRFWGSTSSPQTLDGTLITIIPGFTSHALIAGPELFFPFRIYGLPGEIQAALEVNPSVSYYKEDPDAPGQNSQAFGWYGQLKGRIGLPMGAFVEANILSNGIIAVYKGTGARRRAVVNAQTGEFEQITGGTVTHFNIQAGLGIGLAF